MVALWRPYGIESLPIADEQTVYLFLDFTGQELADGRIAQLSNWGLARWIWWRGAVTRGMRK